MSMSSASRPWVIPMAFDAAVNLLYLVTGTAWHLTARHEPNIRELTTEPMRVEPVMELFERCSWTENVESLDSALVKIQEQLCKMA